MPQCEFVNVLVIPSITHPKYMRPVGCISICGVKKFWYQELETMEVLKSMEELVAGYLLCARPWARHLIFIIPFNHHEESCEVGNMPFLQIRKLRLLRLIYLPKLMGFNLGLSGFRNSQALPLHIPHSHRDTRM